MRPVPSRGLICVVAHGLQALEDVNGRLGERRERLRECDKEIRELTKAKGKLTSQLADLEISAREQRKRLEELEKQRQGAEHKLAATLQENPWVLQERQLFGQPNTDYDFARFPADKARKALADKTTEHEKLGKRINKKVRERMRESRCCFPHHPPCLFFLPSGAGHVREGGGGVPCTGAEEVDRQAGQGEDRGGHPGAR